MNINTLLGIGAIGGAIYLATNKKAQAKVKKTTGLSSKARIINPNSKERIEKIKLKFYRKYPDSKYKVPEKWIKELEKEQVSVRIKNPLKKVVNQFFHKNPLNKLLDELPRNTPEEKQNYFYVNTESKLYNRLWSNDYEVEVVDLKGNSYGDLDDFVIEVKDHLFGSKKDKMENWRKNNKEKMWKSDLTTGKRFKE